MGEVWRAFDTRRERVVAVKRLAGRWADVPAFQERFRREARATAALNSAHVIVIHDYGEIDGRLFIDMRLVPGDDLAAAIAGSPDGLAVPRSIDLAAQIAAGLDAAHGAGLIHRDVKPSNVLLESAGSREHAYLVDFGIAKLADEATGSGLTSTGATLGTPAYMAPELFAGTGQATTRSDVYALGCVLFEMLTGHRPFPGTTAMALMAQHLNDCPPAPSTIRADLAPFDPVIECALAKDPERRHRSSGDLARHAVSVRANAFPDGYGAAHPPPVTLRVPIGDRGAMRSPEGMTSPTHVSAESPSRQRRRGVVAGAGALLLLVVVGVGVIILASDYGSGTPVASATPTASMPPSTTAPSFDQSYSPATSAPPPTSLNGIPVPFGLDPSGAPVRDFTPRGASLTMPAYSSLDLDSSRSDFGLASVPKTDPKLTGSTWAQFDFFFRGPERPGDKVNGVEGFALASPTAYYPSNSDCKGSLAMSNRFEPVINVGAEASLFCVRTDGGRIAVVRVVDSQPAKIVVDILVWEPKMA